MAQGIFGIIDFTGRISDPETITLSMTSFLRNSHADTRVGGDVTPPTSPYVRGGKVRSIPSPLVGEGKGEGDIIASPAISYLFDSHYVLGMKRIPNGQPHQQMHVAQDEKRQTFCAMHGEIFNYQNLVDSFRAHAGFRGDLDLSLHLYKKMGPLFARRLNGLFSLAVMDLHDKQFILLTDRFGMAHQVYWTIVSGRLCFATHLRTLLLIPDVRREVDPASLNLFLKYSYIPSPWTILKNIRKLPPGQMLVFRNGNAEVQSYWEFPPPDNPVTDIEYAVERYRALMRQSIERRICGSGATGILLSGGLDSSANVAFASQCPHGTLKTFSVGFEEPSFDESAYARIVSKHFGTQHYEYTINGKEIEDLPKLVWNLEEPYFEFGLFLTYLGLASARGEASAVIGGECADQLFGTGGFAGGLPAALYYSLQKSRMLEPAKKVGRALKGDYFYAHDNKAFKARMLYDRAVDLNNWYFYGYDERELKLLHKDAESCTLPKIFMNGKRALPGSFASLYHETQVNQDLRHYANENVMVKAGRMADMLDVNLRESYLDTEVADFLVSLAYPLKRYGGLFDHFSGRVKTKFLHRKAMEGLLPPEIMTKPKQGGFVPVMMFLRDKELRNRIYYRLLNSEVMREYFNLDSLRGIFAHYESIQGRKIYWHNFYNAKANRILFLLTFDIWHQYYMDSNPLTVNPVPLTEYISR